MSVQGGPDIISEGLILYLDASNKKSYPGSGQTWFDISGNNEHFDLYNTPSINYNSSGSPALEFPNYNDYARRKNSNVISSMASNGCVDIVLRSMGDTFMNDGSGFPRLVSITNSASTGDDSGGTQGTNNDYSNYFCIARLNKKFYIITRSFLIDIFDKLELQDRLIFMTRIARPFNIYI